MFTVRTTKTVRASITTAEDKHTSSQYMEHSNNVSLEIIDIKDNEINATWICLSSLHRDARNLNF